MEPIIFGTFLFLAIVLWLWAVIDVVKKSFKQPRKNVGWLLIVTFFQLWQVLRVESAGGVTCNVCYKHQCFPFKCGEPSGT